MPVKKAPRKAKATPKTTRGPNSFHHFVCKLPASDPVLAPFKVHAAANDFPDIDAWAEIRSYLLRTGAQHEAIVGARTAWREFQRH